MSEILDPSPSADRDDPLIEYRFEDKESVAIESVFNMLFERLLKEDEL